MPRPRNRNEAKSAVLNIRVTPELKAQLEAHSRMSGSTLSAECERRLLESMQETHRPKPSPETAELLASIERLIGEIELHRGSSWAKGVGAWAAVAEMLRHGPIIEQAPKSIGDEDAKLRHILDQITDVYEECSDIAGRLEVTGATPTYIRSVVVPGAADRADLREHIESLGLPGLSLSRALREIDELEKVDKLYLEHARDLERLLDPIVEAIEQGRNLYPRSSFDTVLGAAITRADAKAREPSVSWTRIAAALTSDIAFGTGKRRSVLSQFPQLLPTLESETE